MKTNFDGIVNTYSNYRYGFKCGTKEYNLLSKLDSIEIIDTVHSNIFTKVTKFLKRNFYTVCNTIIFLGLIVIIMSPFIIDYFTK